MNPFVRSPRKPSGWGFRSWLAGLGSLLVVTGVGTLAGEGAADAAMVRRGRYLMGTRCEIRAPGDEATLGPLLDAALDRIAALEDVMTTWRPDGELARLNAAFAVRDSRAVALSADLTRALAGALEQARRTEGFFDPTIGALATAWGLREGGRIPQAAEIARSRDRTSWRLVELDPHRRTARSRRAGVELDLGGFGKGFALDEAANVLREHGVGAVLLDFGGQILAVGAPPGEPGWLVDVADPVERELPVASLLVRDASVSTSGNAEHTMTVDGRTFGHVLDPRSGRPSDQRGSVTVVAPSGAAADGLSTALFVAGRLRGPTLLPHEAECLYLEPGPVDRSLHVLATAGLASRLVWREDLDLHVSYVSVRSRGGSGE